MTTTTLLQRPEYLPFIDRLMMRFFRLACLFFGIVFILSPHFSWANSLPDQHPIEKELISKAELIFIGTALSLDPQPPYCGKGIFWQKVHFSVQTILKGHLDSEQQKDYVISYQCGVDGQLAKGGANLILASTQSYHALEDVMVSLKTVPAVKESIDFVRSSLDKKYD
ncbi:MAG: hypothetical protein SFW62_09400 [Alphaproteobacteria bacterium]|nr:hypothetical protein [Alphaproteobacteria bacterium]